MSFTYGAFGTDSLGLIAILRDMPSLAGLQLETLEAPGTDGLILGGTSRSKSSFVFDVIIRGATRTDAEGKRDAVALALDPVRGEQDLTTDALDGWRWRAITAKQIDWGRITWDRAAGYLFRADVTFEVLEAYGRAVVDEVWERTTSGTTTVARTKGNARSFPTVEIQGTLTSAQTVTVTVGDVQVVVDGPLGASEVLRLDYDSFEFARWNGAMKVAGVVRKMSTLDRPELWPNTATPFRVSTTGTLTSARLYANSRRQ